MANRSILAGLLGGAILLGTTTTHTVAQDTYAGGAAVAYLPQEFVLGGANPIGVNFAFPGTPFVPVVGGGGVRCTTR